MFDATDLFGLALTFLARALLQEHGLKVSLLIFAGILFTIPSLSIWLLRERKTVAMRMVTSSLKVQPPALPSVIRQEALRPAVTPPTTSLTVPSAITEVLYHQWQIFYVIILSNLVHAVAFYSPLLYLPSFSTSLQSSPWCCYSRRR